MFTLSEQFNVVRKNCMGPGSERKEVYLRFTCVFLSMLL